MSLIKRSCIRRRSSAVRVTDGWKIKHKTGKERQVFKEVGYYKSRTDAMIALAEYNQDPYDIDARKVTFDEIYSKWSKEKYRIGRDDQASKALDRKSVV